MNKKIKASAYLCDKIKWNEVSEKTPKNLKLNVEKNLTKLDKGYIYQPRGEQNNPDFLILNPVKSKVMFLSVKGNAAFNFKLNDTQIIPYYYHLFVSSEKRGQNLVAYGNDVLGEDDFELFSKDKKSYLKDIRAGAPRVKLKTGHTSTASVRLVTENSSSTYKYLFNEREEYFIKAIEIS